MDKIDLQGSVIESNDSDLETGLDEIEVNQHDIIFK